MIWTSGALAIVALLLVGSRAGNAEIESRHNVAQHSQPQAARQSPLLRLRIVDVGKVSPRWNATVRRSLEKVSPRIESDLHVTMPRLTVRLYGNRPLFSRAVKGADGLRPAGLWDTAGNVVDNTLILGPSLSWTRHRLAHIISEWIFDRLTHNVSDAEPRPAWLYDGLAEVEAQRVTPRLTCTLHGHMPLSLSRLANPHEWQTIRTTSLIWLEYCEARTAANHVITRIGWTDMISDLHNASSWAAFAVAVGVAN